MVRERAVGRIYDFPDNQRVGLIDCPKCPMYQRAVDWACAKLEAYGEHGDAETVRKLARGGANA